MFENQKVAVKSAIRNWNLNEDLVIRDEGYPLEILGNMNLNGHSLIVKRNVIIRKGNYNLNGENCKIEGNLVLETGMIKLNGGNLEVDG